jgi:nucleoside phosphorylase
MTSVILVPQGAEHGAVCAGSKSHLHPPQVIPIPVGSTAVELALAQLPMQDFTDVLVMGLCGSLSPLYEIGAIVVYQSCTNFSNQTKFCDRALTQRLQDRFQVSSVRALTSDRVICSATEKQTLGKTYQAEVVDMEGFAVLSSLQIPVAMIRVVSDDARHDLPDLSRTLDDEGNLQGLAMARAMVRAPIAATRLIRGSLKGLNTLRRIASLSH